MSKFIPKSNETVINVEDDLPKLSHNALKLKELENKMNSIESAISQFKSEFNKNKENKLQLKNEIESIHKETKDVYVNFNIGLTNKIKNSFINQFDDASRSVVLNENKRKAAEDTNYEYESIILELEKRNDHLIIQNKNKEEQNLYLIKELNNLKKANENLLIENTCIRNSNTKKDEQISNLDTELNEIRNVLGKLTEIRVILNKYFSSHFENFT